MVKDVVFDACFDFSKDEHKQFKEYNSTSDNPLLPLFSILQSICPTRNDQGDVLHVSKKQGVLGGFTGLSNGDLAK